MTLPGLVELPEKVNHGTPNAYSTYKCRCPVCKAWRRGYDRRREERQRLDRLAQQHGSMAYLKEKGVRFYGPGPFRKNPFHLAAMIAAYLNDDIYLYIRDYRRRNPLPGEEEQ